MENQFDYSDWIELGNCNAWGSDTDDTIWSAVYETPYNSFIGAI